MQPKTIDRIKITNQWRWSNPNIFDWANFLVSEGLDAVAPNGLDPDSWSYMVGRGWASLGYWPLDHENFHSVPIPERICEGFDDWVMDHAS